MIAGGHTVQDKEPKFGLVVIGFVASAAHPHQGRRAARRPAGTDQAAGFWRHHHRPQTPDRHPTKMWREVVGWMTRLNREAGQLASELELRAGTDVTGFSLLGHAMEMAEASGVGLRFEFASIPFVSCARKYAEQWTFPGGAADNKLHFGPSVIFSDAIDEADQMLLFDPQTSGGLLLAVPPEKVKEFEARAAALNQPVWQIGKSQHGSGIEVF